MGRLLGRLAPVASTPSHLVEDEFRLDERPDLLNLCANSYRDTSGKIPIFTAVKRAERRLCKLQTTKTRLPAGGDPAFHVALSRLVLGDSVPLEQQAAVTTSGATGAIRLALELLHELHPETTLWVPAPCGRPYTAQARRLGLNLRTYPHISPDTGTIDSAAMLACLAACAPGDVIVVHGCGHDPTGIDLPHELWAALAGLCHETGALPLVDLSFLGFGLGLDKDTDALQGLVMAVPEAIIAVSCSHTFGLAQDRAGLLLLRGDSQIDTSRAQQWLDQMQSDLCGSPADHGPRVVTEILDSADLRDGWSSELRQMRMRLNQTRADLASALTEATGSDRWGELATGRGLFSLLPLSPEQVRQLRQDHGIYLPDTARLNVSTLTSATIPRLAEALAACLGKRPADETSPPMQGPPAPRSDAAETGPETEADAVPETGAQPETDSDPTPDAAPDSTDQTAGDAAETDTDAAPDNSIEDPPEPRVANA